MRARALPPNLLFTPLNLSSFAHHADTSHSSIPSRLIFPMAISINGHNLFLSAIGPDRIPGTPLVILVSDIGGSSSPWPLVIWHLSPFVRIYIHDRAGFGKSEVNPLANNRRPKTYAEKAAEDLDKLLQKVGVEDPFILVPMFWGGTCCQRILGAEERSRRWHGVDRMRPGKDE